MHRILTHSLATASRLGLVQTIHVPADKSVTGQSQILLVFEDQRFSLLQDGEDLGRSTPDGHRDPQCHPVVDILTRETAVSNGLVSDEEWTGLLMNRFFEHGGDRERVESFLETVTNVPSDPGVLPWSVLTLDELTEFRTRVAGYVRLPGNLTWSQALGVLRSGHAVSSSLYGEHTVAMPVRLPHEPADASASHMALLQVPAPRAGVPIPSPLEPVLLPQAIDRVPTWHRVILKMKPEADAAPKETGETVWDAFHGVAEGETAPAVQTGTLEDELVPFGDPHEVPAGKAWISSRPPTPEELRTLCGGIRSMVRHVGDAVSADQAVLYMQSGFAVSMEGWPSGEFMVRIDAPAADYAVVNVSTVPPAIEGFGPAYPFVVGDTAKWFKVGLVFGGYHPFLDALASVLDSPEAPDGSSRDGEASPSASEPSAAPETLPEPPDAPEPSPLPPPAAAPAPLAALPKGGRPRKGRFSSQTRHGRFWDENQLLEIARTSSVRKPPSFSTPHRNLAWDAVFESMLEGKFAGHDDFPSSCFGVTADGTPVRIQVADAELGLQPEVSAFAGPPPLKGWWTAQLGGVGPHDAHVPPRPPVSSVPLQEYFHISRQTRTGFNRRTWSDVENVIRPGTYGVRQSGSDHELSFVDAWRFMSEGGVVAKSDWPMGRVLTMVTAVEPVPGIRNPLRPVYFAHCEDVGGRRAVATAVHVQWTSAGGVIPPEIPQDVAEWEDATWYPVGLHREGAWVLPWETGRGRVACPFKHDASTSEPEPAPEPAPAPADPDRSPIMAPHQLAEFQEDIESLTPVGPELDWSGARAVIEAGGLVMQVGNYGREKGRAEVLTGCRELGADSDAAPTLLVSLVRGSTRAIVTRPFLQVPPLVSGAVFREVAPERRAARDFDQVNADQPPWFESLIHPRMEDLRHMSCARLGYRLGYSDVDEQEVADGEGGVGILELRAAMMASPSSCWQHRDWIRRGSTCFVMLAKVSDNPEILQEVRISKTNGGVATWSHRFDDVPVAPGKWYEVQPMWERARPFEEEFQNGDGDTFRVSPDGEVSMVSGDSQTILPPSATCLKIRPDPEWSEKVRAWGKRNGIEDEREARVAVDDARSLHLAPANSLPPDGTWLGQALERLHPTVGRASGKSHILTHVIQETERKLVEDIRATEDKIEELESPEGARFDVGATHEPVTVEHLPGGGGIKLREPVTVLPGQWLRVTKDPGSNDLVGEAFAAPVRMDEFRAEPARPDTDTTWATEADRAPK